MGESEESRIVRLETKMENLDKKLDKAEGRLWQLAAVLIIAVVERVVTHLGAGG